MASTAAIESPRRDNNYFSANMNNNISNEDEDEGSTNNMAANYQEEDDFPLIDEEDEDYFDTQYFHQSSTQSSSSTSQQQKHISNSSSEEQSNEDAWVQLLNLPPNLTSQNLAPVGGMRRVSSCYFSIASNMSNDSPNNNNNTNNTMRRVFSSTSLASQFGYDALSFDGRNPTDFLLHDILMNVFTFLDARSLASFSETGRRCNFECFYFMELQLQRALLMGSSHVGDCDNERDKGDNVDTQVDNESEQNDGEENVDDIGLLLQDDEEIDNNDAAAADEDEIPTTRKRSNAVPSFEGSISGTGVISRLASLDSASARKIVQTYLDSNTSIHALPLSHSLAYFRQLLARQSQNLPIPSFPLRGRGEGGAATTSSALNLPTPNISENMAKNARNMALFFTFIGAAYMRTHQGGGDMPLPPITMPDPSEVLTEENMEALKNMMGFGFVAGGMLKAGKTMKEKADQANASASDSDDDNGGENQQQGNTVEDADVAAGISRQPQQGRSSSIGSLEDLSNMLHHPSKIASRLYNAFSSNSSLDTTGSTTVEESHSSTSTKRRHRSKRSHRTIRHSDIDEEDELDDVGEASCSEEKLPSSSEDENDTSSPLFKDEEHKTKDALLSSEEIQYNLENHFSPNPYEHPSSSTLNTMGRNGSNSNMNEGDAAAAATSAATSFFSAFSKQESIDEGNVPSGCIGAYTRAVKAAASEVTRLVKEERKRNFETLEPDEQLELGVRFIDACTSDSKIDIVKDILQKQKMMDVDRFFVGPDDTETCALHAAAFNGAEKVLEFLCGGIDEHDGDEDCGLCDVNVTDANGWTALHFASGANSVTSVKVLAKHGAKLTIEASNGYTPYHWAERLSNEEVRTALADLGADNRFVTGGWMLSSPGQDDVRRIPFVSFMANRFFGHHTN